MAEPDQRRATAAWLASPAAVGPLADAREVLASAPRDPLRAATLLRDRHPALGADRAAAALEQAELGRLARDRYGHSGNLLLTRDGLEAATRPQVAVRRARLLAQAGARRVLDVTGGLGSDAAAMLSAGLAVTAVDRDPVTATFLAANCPGARVIEADATEPAVLAELLAELSATDVVFVDPARRDPAGPRDRATARARPERDPERWSPPWSMVAAIEHPRVAAKVAPGFTPPGGWEAEWVSYQRTVVECSLFSWALTGSARRAVILGSGPATVISAEDADAPVAGGIDAWVHEPDPAVLRAAALSALAHEQQVARLDSESSWLTGDRPSTSAAMRSYLVVAELTGSRRRQRQRLAELGVTRVTVKSRDVAADPREVVRALGVREGSEHVVVLTRRQGREITLLTQPAAARSR